MHIDNPYSAEYFPRLNGHNNGFRKYVNGEFERFTVTTITPNDIVLSIRLGRDYLGQHRFRLLVGIRLALLGCLIRSRCHKAHTPGGQGICQKLTRYTFQ